MYMPSHVGDDIARATWPWRDVYAESCSYRLDHCSYGLGPRDTEVFCHNALFTTHICSVMVFISLEDMIFSWMVLPQL
jgi:hypothetical protein